MTKLFIIMNAIFCTLIVTGNLIFQKFVSIDLYLSTFEISVGVLLYPVTFLISDLVTEFYGVENAKFMVRNGVICSLIVMLLLAVSDFLSATDWSIVDDQTFHMVFNAFGIASFASIVANYVGQVADIHIFAHIKYLTKGRHLWIRNNVSTIVAQFIDTTTVVTMLAIFSIIPWDNYMIIMYSSIFFKVIAALLDTPFCYLGHYFISRISQKN
ncbi:MAG: queuosine precursor transporter [Rickettsiales bacterium]|nr:queuosine precursor transporter [Rickettsiales bacterium]